MISVVMIKFKQTLYALSANFTSTFTSVPGKMSNTVINDLLQIFRGSVSAVLPDKIIKNTIKYNEINGQLFLAGENYDVANKNVYLLGTGKAVQSMAKEVENILGSKIKEGIISVPVGSLSKDQNSTNKKILYYEGAKNNLPDAQAEATALKVKNLVTNLTSNDILLVLISGGGSALLPLPKEPITLKEKTLLVKKLANAGADITEVNTVRKSISAFKGGKLAIEAQPAEILSLILSDIVGDPLDLIASGPTVENQDQPSAAINIIEKFDLYNQLSDSVKTVLNESRNNKEFPRSKVKNFIIGSNKISINAAKDEAKNLGYYPIDLSNVVTGNISNIAQEYVKLIKIIIDFMTKKINEEFLKEAASSLNIPGISNKSLDDEIISNLKNKDICLILGGEITVAVKGTGVGGRNQQLALEFSKLVYKHREHFNNFEVYLLSAGTDGIDGPTDAAGAIGYLDLVSDAEKANIDVDKYLLNNDSYNFFKQFQNGLLHVITGHTNTNVMDIHLIIIKKKL